MATTNTNLAYIDKLDKESIQNLTNLYNQQGIHSGALTDMTSQFKQNTGRDNTIGTTIGNASLNNYGYSVVNGQIRQTGGALNEPGGWYGTPSGASAQTVQGTVGSTATAKPATNVSPTINGVSQTINADGTLGPKMTPEEAQKAYQDKVNSYANANKGNEYMNLYDSWSQMMKSNNDDYLRYLGEANQNQLNLINQNADNAARQYYQNYLSQKYALPEQLSNLGITGGASETAALGLMSNYSQNLGQNESNRNTNIANQNIEYNRILAENSKNLADQLADTYLSMAQKQLQLDMDNREKAEADMKQNAIDTWNSNVSANMQARLKEGKDVYSWYDNNGKLHYSTNEDNARGSGYEYSTNTSAKKEAEEKAASEAKAKEIEATNQKVEKAAMDAYDKGSEVYIWHDEDGYLHWSTSKVRAAAESDKFVTIAQPKASKTGTTGSTRSTGGGGGGGGLDDLTGGGDEPVAAAPPKAVLAPGGTFKDNQYYNQIFKKISEPSYQSNTEMQNLATSVAYNLRNGYITQEEAQDLLNRISTKLSSIPQDGTADGSGIVNLNGTFSYGSGR